MLHATGGGVGDDAGQTPAVLNTNTGAQVGTFDSRTAPAFGDGTAVLLGPGGLTAVDAGTRATLWTQAGDGQLASAPVIAGGTAYVGSGSGTVYGYSLGTGRQVWAGDALAPVLPPDEHNAQQLQGLAVGGGVLAVPASTRLTVFG